VNIAVDTRIVSSLQQARPFKYSSIDVHVKLSQLYLNINVETQLWQFTMVIFLYALWINYTKNKF